jgi:hypothetical protein
MYTLQVGGLHEELRASHLRIHALQDQALASRQSLHQAHAHTSGNALTGIPPPYPLPLSPPLSLSLTALAVHLTAVQTKHLDALSTRSRAHIDPLVLTYIHMKHLHPLSTRSRPHLSPPPPPSPFSLSLPPSLPPCLPAPPPSTEVESKYGDCMSRMQAAEAAEERVTKVLTLLALLVQKDKH